MKKLLPLFLLMISLVSCKVSETVTVDTFANEEILKGYQSFKLIEEDYFDKRNKRIKLLFKKKLLEYGFEESSENPDFLIQGVIVSRDFIERAELSNSPIPGPFYRAISRVNYLDNFNEGLPSSLINSGMIGKTIFLIQDAKTNDIAWMGISSGVVFGGGRQFDLEKMDLVLHQLLTSLY
uniref:DUF4136 domain-containing protein n=1 Tax=Algoriphagus sp. TaxID=1872435 RepID=UPI00258374E2|nr:DUF4136 domain-containing protein [Algoriphagus sp.]